MIKNILLSIIGFFAFQIVSNAQLPDGSIAPDFTVTDVYGETHNLYSYLDDGYTVFLDMMATWCGYCWNHHNSKAFENLYTQYGPSGTNEIIVIMIEVDFRTNEDCLRGNAGCNYGTNGNWLAGTSHPIADDSSIKSLYQVGYYPTIYGVCPNKRITEVGQRSTQGYYSWHQDQCALKVQLEEKEDNMCFDDEKGIIEVSATGGKGSYTYNWTNGGSNSRISNARAGVHYCTVSDGARSVIGGPFNILEPQELEVLQELIRQPSCATDGKGTADIVATGGVSPYDIQWNDGSNLFSRSDLTEGSYSYTISDINLCEIFSDGFDIDELNLPPVGLTSDTIYCDGSEVVLSVNNAESYAWSNGGTEQTNIFELEGDTWMFVTVTLSSGCNVVDSVFVEAKESPQISLELDQKMDCNNQFTELKPEESMNPSFAYFWESLNGTGIQGNPNSYSIMVSEPGEYRLRVTDLLSNCMSEEVLQLSPDPDMPTISAIVSNEIDCINNSAIIDATNSSQGSAFTYSWSSQNPNSTLMNDQSLAPSVSAPGIYFLTIRNLAKDCELTNSILVENGALKSPYISIGNYQEGSDLVFYNQSVHEAIDHQWTLPDGSTSTQSEVRINQSDLGSIVQICLEASNQCGLTYNRCQELDINDQDYYFSGRLTDQFNLPIESGQVYNNGSLSSLSNTGGYFNIGRVPFGEDLKVSTSLESVQSNDVNEFDFLRLYDHLVNGLRIGDELIELAADIDNDGLITTTDLLLLRRTIIGQTGSSRSDWIVKDKQCLQAFDINSCSDEILLKELQNSQLSNDFICVQIGDLVEDGNGIAGLMKELQSADLVGGETVELIDGRLISAKIHDFQLSDVLYINGNKYSNDRLNFYGNDAVLLDFIDENMEEVELKIIRSERDNEENKAVQLYPMPVKDILEIRVKDEINNSSVRLMDVTGQVDAERKLLDGNGDGSYFLDMTGSKAGIYFIEFELDGIKQLNKLIKLD